MASRFIHPLDAAGDKGKIGETIAQLVLWKARCNVYTKFLDTDAIDVVVRTERKEEKGHIFKEIQVKYSKNHGKQEGIPHFWFPIRRGAFNPRPNYYFMFICGDEDNIILIPSLTLNNYIPQLKLESNRVDHAKDKWNVNVDKFPEGIYFTNGKVKVLNLQDYYNNFECLK